MMFSTADKIAAVDWLLDDLREWRDDHSAPEARAFHALKAIAVDLRAQTPKEAGKVRRAMEHQVNVIKRTKAQIGYLEYGQLMALADATCGRWWPIIQRALERYEQEVSKEVTA